jgi:O-acetyl-ADP-ribose deacetylase (regulator of RNase III)
MNEVLRRRALTGSITLELVRGDLTEESSDAIVNAANAQLAHGAGVAGAIVRRGGPAIQRESEAWVRRHGPVSHASPAWTSGGSLPSKYVIHAVGPVWGEGDEERKLADAVRGSLRLADELRLASVSIPAISTGIFGFPRDRAAKVILAAISACLEGSSSGMKLVRLVLFDDETIKAFLAEWEKPQ